jgi:hypothetical protein
MEPTRALIVVGSPGCSTDRVSSPDPVGSPTATAGRRGAYAVAVARRAWQSQAGRRAAGAQPRAVDRPGNIVVSIVYVFLVRALLRGRRWAYRRVIWLGAAGMVALVLLQLTPYPVWMRVEQLLQALVLGALLYFVLQPSVRAHFASGLPGRDVRRFGRRR